MISMEAFAVFIGGGIGAGLRYLFSLWANKKYGLTYWATFIINILGCMFLGFISTFAIKHQDVINSTALLFLTTGIAGGFTTFSTFSLENINLLKEGKTLKCFIYTFASLFFGLLGILLGFLIANCIITDYLVRAFLFD